MGGLVELEGWAGGSDCHGRRRRQLGVLSCNTSSSRSSQPKKKAVKKPYQDSFFFREHSGDNTPKVVKKEGNKINFE